MKITEEIVGRLEEVEALEDIYFAKKSDFVAVYGRRRVGKTYLIRSLFNDRITFQLTGVANATTRQQLDNFKISFKQQYPKHKVNNANTWLNAFEQIKLIIQKSKRSKKVIFIDELPWFDNTNSGFIQALEHFWNGWASARKDILLIACGSAASWMINELINNKGGLHNRVTRRFKIEPFTLKECELYTKAKKLNLEKYQILQLYMALGGIPFYWDEVEKGLSATQNIDKICFSKNGILRTEFPNIFKSLFGKDEKHQAIVEALAKKNKGLTREEIIRQTKVSNGGGLSRILNELEESGFVHRYTPFGKKVRNSLYQVSDFYTLFYLRFVKNFRLTEKKFWIKTIDSPAYRAWSGFAFERICLYHVEQIKQALGIGGVETQVSSWRSIESANGSQIDLVIDRRDEVINLCEMKFSINPFKIDKKYNAELRNKIGIFKNETKTRKAVFLTMITTYGLQQNEYSGTVQNSLKMDILFN